MNMSKPQRRSWCPETLFILCCSALLFLTYCTKPTVHYLRPVVLVSPDSREFFGCRINGHPFSPVAPDSSALGSCTYTPYYRGDSGWVFKISGNRHEEDCAHYTVSITLDSVHLEVGKTYHLGSPGPKKNYGSYAFVPGCSRQKVELFSFDERPGIITITKLDRNKKIVTGTFDFRVRDQNGFIFRMSDGAFDRHYGH
jgi:hypothetical protein